MILKLIITALISAVFSVIVSTAISLTIMIKTTQYIILTIDKYIDNEINEMLNQNDLSSKAQNGKEI